ncbi:MAG: GNAT family N-acetyltransferase, partial [Ktedonobacteraceae bacterium]|nr:GNAT family N-acetyltransferase [Ktedonobacteraceae bacterium]
MLSYRFTNALSYSLSELCEMHNESFSGYLVPATMTPEQIANFWRIYQIDASRCVVMHDQNGAFVGLARMGTRGRRGWCGGFGIAPQFRGKGTSQQLASQMIEVARESGLATLQLEVLAQNIRALKVYEKAGFVTRRRLIGIEIALQSLPEGTPIAVERVEAMALLSRSDSDPCWQREASTVLSVHTEAFAASDSAGQVNGLIVERAGEKLRILAAVVQSELTDAELAILLRSAAADATSI